MSLSDNSEVGFLMIKARCSGSTGLATISTVTGSVSDSSGSGSSNIAVAGNDSSFLSSGCLW